MLEIDQIENIISDNKGGLKLIEITDLANPDFDATATIYSLPFRVNTAKLGESSGTGPGGYFTNQTVSCILPKRRGDVQKLLKKLANTEFCIRVTDYNDTITKLIPARINHKYGSGENLGASNAYEVQFVGVDIYSIGYKKTATATLSVPDPIIPGQTTTPVNTPPPADPPGAGESGPDLSECAIVVIDPYQTYNDINANFENLPAAYTLEIRLGGVVKATALPYTITETGVYYIAVITTECEKTAGLYCELNQEANDFTISITVGETILTAVTDAAAPTYLWELETEGGNRVTLGSEATQDLGASGIYHLTIIDGGTKTAYYLYQSKNPLHVEIDNITEMANPYRLVDAYDSVSGFEFTPSQIDVSKVNNPAIQLTVKRGTNVLHYVAGTPADVDEYTITGGKYTVWATVPLSNEDFLVKLN